MLKVSRRRPLGPGEKIVAGIVGLVVLAAAVVVVISVTRGSECEQGLQEVEGSCMGVSAGDFAKPPAELTGLVQKIAEENKNVEGGDEPSRRIALTMPFSWDDTSAMPAALIQHGLAGAAAAQYAANHDRGGGPKYQLLLADIGKQMKDGRKIADRLKALATSEGPPLIATAGLGSSTSDSKEFITKLKKDGIPSMGPVITSSDMNAGRYFFKNSPSNVHFVGALKKWLEDNGSDGTKYLVYADRVKDTYSVDLRDRLMQTFGDKYDLKRNSSSFIGTRGDDAGTPNLFRIPSMAICSSDADTVFYAGRDEDLPALVEQLVSDNCHEKPLRILKVGIGLPAELTGKEITAQMREADIQLVNAAAVDPEWQREESQPQGFATFRKNFDRVAKGEEWNKSKPLEDGYAVMYYDAVHTLAHASDLAYEDVGEEKKQEKPSEARIVRNDVHNKLLNLNPDSRGSDNKCDTCIKGAAAGTYGFSEQTSKGLWPVCKAVHVLEYPASKAARRGDGKNSGKQAKSADLYRTYEGPFRGHCPQKQ